MVAKPRDCFMWDEHKSNRLQQLRTLEQDASLSDAQKAELACLIDDLDAAEAGYLTPATERIGRERKSVESQNRALETLVQRKSALVQRLQHVLAETQAERNAIERELAAVLADTHASNTHE